MRYRIATSATPAVTVLATEAAALWLLWLDATAARAACCYFSAKDKDVNQPAQKAFITWDPAGKVESFTAQPKFEGNAQDFGMVVPTPGRPKLDEMPRDFFKELAVFTILEPMDMSKYKPMRPTLQSIAGAGGARDARGRSVSGSRFGRHNWCRPCVAGAADLGV
jgi:hypothetical protein